MLHLDQEGEALVLVRHRRVGPSDQLDTAQVETRYGSRES